MYTRDCTRAKPFFPPVLNPATIPNNTQTFGKDTSERYCELSPRFWFLRYFFPQSFSQHVIPTIFAQNQVDIQSETKKDVYNCYSFFTRSFARSRLLQKSRFFVIPFIFPRRHAIISFQINCTRHIWKFQDFQTISKRYISDIFRVISSDRFFFIRKKEKKTYLFRSNNF